MSFVEELFLAMFRLFLGESAEEKDFRRGMSKAQSLYQAGLKYDGEREYREALTVLKSIPDQGAEGSKDRYQKVKLQILINLKLCQYIINWFSQQSKRLEKIGDNALGGSTPDELQNRMVEIAEEVKRNSEERNEILNLPPTRKTEERLSELKENGLNLGDEQNLIHDKLVSYKTTESKLDEYRRKTIANLGDQIDAVMQFISEAREIKDLPESEKYRAHTNLHRYFSQTKEYQTILDSLQNGNDE